MPALFTRMSMRPPKATAACASAATSASLETSARTAVAAAPSRSATAAAPSPLPSATITFAPSATKRLAIPSPNPDAAPVTIATLPASLPALSSAMPQQSAGAAAEVQGAPTSNLIVMARLVRATHDHRLRSGVHGSPHYAAARLQRGMTGGWNSSGRNRYRPNRVELGEGVARQG